MHRPLNSGLGSYNMRTRSLLSVVVPAFNEESNVRLFYDAITEALVDLQDEVDLEIIIVDDGSSDSTFELVSQLAIADSRVRGLRLSRNFGSHAALMAGMRSARGDSVVILSIDLQDPPALIPKLVARWREGFHVVWATREGRDEGVLTKLFACSFYWVFRRIALPEYPAKGTDFGLFDRCVVDNLVTLKEVNHFIIGQIVWLGFRVSTIEYRREKRASGRSKWSIGRKIKNALDAIVSFSYFPIRLISYVGLFVSATSFFYAAVIVFLKLFVAPDSPFGWASTTVAILFLGGVQLTMLGVVGEYVWRCNEQLKGRPQYIVMETTVSCEKGSSTKIGVNHECGGTVHQDNTGT